MSAVRTRRVSCQRCAFERGDFRQDVAEQVGFAQQVEGDGAVRVGEHAADFHADALGADRRQFAGHRLDGGERGRLDREVERGGEAHGAEHAELVFGETQARVADGADQLALEVVVAADVIDDFVGDRIEEQAVDREVAALGVVLGVGEGTLSGWRPSLYVGVGAEGGDFDLALLPRGPSTVITPNAAPMASVRRRPKRSRISSGVALVATS